MATALVTPKTNYGSTHNCNGDDDGYLSEGSNSSNSTLGDSEHDLLQKKKRLLDKASNFDIPYDSEKGYRGTQLKLHSFHRPHMRVFHGSWICYCCGWLLWFSISPLLPYIMESHELNKSQLWTSNMLSMTGAVILRLVLGPLCDQYGAKDILTGLLGSCAVFCALGGLIIQDYSSLLLYRSLLGLIGGGLVPAQYWITACFIREVCGMAMALAAGWAAIGGGLAQVCMGALIFPFFNEILGLDDDMAWRVSFVVPAAVSLAVAYYFKYYSDDSPLGSYQEVIRAGLMREKSAVDSFRSGAFNINAWLLFFQFGSCLGIELTMECALSLHLSDRFQLSIQSASAIASLYGLMNIFTRGLGGYISDYCYKKYSLRGRLLIHWAMMVLEGLFILFFSYTTSLNSTLVVMILFASFGQMSMGTCFGIVPYVDGPNTGTIAGIVGAGGNVGAIWLGNVFRIHDDIVAFRVMGIFAIAMSCLTPLIIIKGYRGVFFGTQQQQGGGTPLLNAARVQKRNKAVTAVKRQSLIVPGP